jgi:hypothetical protein
MQFLANIKFPSDQRYTVHISSLDQSAHDARQRLAHIVHHEHLIHSSIRFFNMTWSFVLNLVYILHALIILPTLTLTYSVNDLSLGIVRSFEFKQL